jgi:hypothetical protein
MQTLVGRMETIFGECRSSSEAWRLFLGNANPRRKNGDYFWGMETLVARIETLVLILQVFAGGMKTIAKGI